MTIEIKGLGLAVPKKIVPNEEFSTYLNTSDEWIFSHTGIKERRWKSQEGEECSDLAAKAALESLGKAGVSAEEVDLILVATSTPDYWGFPSVAALVQDKIKAVNAVGFDISAACAGYVFAIETARGMASLGYETILVIGAETFSDILDKGDRVTSVLFGDGAGATLLQTTQESGRGILDGHLVTEGEGAEFLKVVSSEEGGGRPTVQMNGREVYNFGIRSCQFLIETLLERNHFSLEDLRLIVPHQANIRMIEALCKRAKIPQELFFMNLEEYGNTSAASIPIALYEAQEKGRLERGDLVLLLGFGAGLNYGGVLIRW